jgi:CubicO group peptidase (beta-lactamase class C family)
MKSRYFVGLVLAACVALVSIGRAEEPAIRAAIQPFVDSHSLAGAVALVADKDKILTVDAVGYSDVAAKTLMGSDAVFWIASQSKPITAAALMILVDEGKIDLDDPIEKYLPEFKGHQLAEKKGAPLKQPARLVTVRDCLRHTSGMPFSTAIESPTLDALPLKDGVHSYATTPLTYEPGTDYRYSNAGINTAGRIIEVVKGMAYEEFLQKRLLDPCGMKETTFWPSEDQVKRLAKSYKPNATKDGLVELKIGQLHYPLSDHAVRYPMPAGGLFSTAQDVSRFCRMLLRGGELDGNRVLSEKAVAEMSKRQTPENLKSSYGLGLSVNKGSFGHGGAMATDMTIDVEHGLVLVWCVQHAGFPGNGGQAREAFRKAALQRFAAK